MKRITPFTPLGCISPNFITREGLTAWPAIVANRDITTFKQRINDEASSNVMCIVYCAACTSPFWYSWAFIRSMSHYLVLLYKSRCPTTSYCYMLCAPMPLAIYVAPVIATSWELVSWFKVGNVIIYCILDILSHIGLRHQLFLLLLRPFEQSPDYWQRRYWLQGLLNFHYILGWLRSEHLTGMHK